MESSTVGQPCIADKEFFSNIISLSEAIRWLEAVVLWNFECNIQNVFQNNQFFYF